MRTQLLAPLAVLAITGCMADAQVDSADLDVEDSELVAGERFPLLADLTYDVGRPNVAVRCFDATGRFAFKVTSFMFVDPAQRPELYSVLLDWTAGLDEFTEHVATLNNAAGSSTVLFGTTASRVAAPTSITNTALTFEVDPARTDAREITGRGTIAGVPGTWGCELFNRAAVANAAWHHVL